MGPGRGSIGVLVVAPSAAPLDPIVRVLLTRTVNSRSSPNFNRAPPSKYKEFYLMYRRDIINIDREEVGFHRLISVDAGEEM